MRKFKLFIITLVIVLLIGGLGMLFLRPEKAAVADGEAQQAVNTSVSPSVSAGISSSAAGAGTATVDLTPNTQGNEGVPAEEAAVPAETEESLPEAVVLGEGMAEDNTYLVHTAEEGKVRLAFAGDILFDPGYAIYAQYRQRGGRLEACVSADLLEHMRAADVCIVNNEFPYSDRGTPLENKTYTFRAAPESVSLLKEMGVDIAGVANNHAFDYGMDAFVDTMDTLAGANIPYAGGGRNLAEAKQPIYLYAGGMKIAIVASTQIERYDAPQSRGATETEPGLLRSYPKIDPTLEAIRTAKAESDFVILLIHWGTELKEEPDWGQNEQLPKFIEAGADAVIGAHPHILQQIAYKNGVPVVYSLGNFWFNSKTLDTCLIELTLSEGGVESLRFLPCLQTNSSVRLLHDAEADRVLEYMRSISPTINIDGDGYITAK
ncbi:MAG: CapA family protein [Lachnospiraceae bacterium]|nr:CapA family protein [Lachnospiraceae bacterium]